jgi:signal transduction histidine kinase
MLFTENDVPQSELIIPIKSALGKTVALFNFEHRELGAFLKYHIEMGCKMAADVGPFARFVLSEMDKYIDKEKELRYLMLRVASRLSRTQIHKTKNNFGLLISALSEAKREMSAGRQTEAVAEILAAEDKVSLIKNISLDFNANISDFIRFGRRSIKSLVRDVIPDSKTQVSFAGDNIEFALDAMPDDAFIFCSGLAREHLYGVIQNSIEQFVLRRRSTPAFSGLIRVGFRKIARKEMTRNIDTYDLLEISVTDNGGGVPKEYEDNIFEPEFSLKKATGGTGFGLPSAKEYMERIGGQLAWENGWPEGATFRLQFPEYTEALHDGMAEQLNIIQ